jgi:hypothetical protein
MNIYFHIILLICAALHNVFLFILFNQFIFYLLIFSILFLVIVNDFNESSFCTYCLLSREQLYCKLY